MTTKQKLAAAAGAILVALALAWLTGLLPYLIVGGVSFALGTAFPHVWDSVKADLPS